MNEVKVKYEAIYPPPKNHPVRLIVKAEPYPDFDINAETEFANSYGELILRIQDDRNELPIVEKDKIYIVYPLEDSLYEAESSIIKIEADSTENEKSTIIHIDTTSKLKKVERRNMFRFPVSLPIHYFQEGVTSSLCSGETVNISGTGLCIDVETSLKEGKSIMIYFQLQGTHITLPSQVIWTKPLEGYTVSNRAGVCFTKICPKDQNRITKFIYNLQRNKINEMNAPPPR